MVNRTHLVCARELARLQSERDRARHAAQELAEWLGCVYVVDAEEQETLRRMFDPMGMRVEVRL